MLPSTPSPVLRGTQLSAKVVELEAELRKRSKRNRELEHANSRLLDENADLKKDQDELLARIQLLTHRAGGAPTIQPGQRTIFDELEPDVATEIESLAAPATEAAEVAQLDAEDAKVPDGETAEDAGPTAKKQRRPRDQRKIDESNLRREVVRTELPEDERRCPDTGVELQEVGVKISRELAYRSAEVYVIEHHRVEYGPPPEVAEVRRIEPILAPMHEVAVEGVAADASLLAHIAYQKYCLHLPLYRQEESFAQCGVHLARQTLCDWIAAVAFALKPIAWEIEKAVRAGPVLQMDDTPIRVKRSGPSGDRVKIRQSYLWVLRNPDVGGVVFRYTRGRGTEDVRSILLCDSASASLQVLVGDGYQANRSGARAAGLELVFAGCWAHCLRKFRDAMSEAANSMGLFLRDISTVYEVEQRANEEGLSCAERLELRRRESAPIVVRLMRLTSNWKKEYSLDGKVADAMKYLRGQRRELLAFLRDGRVPIDNNDCERSIRPVAIGRKNWLFAGSEAGAEWAATLYTLIESAKASKVEPRAYLEAVLRRVGYCPASRIADLTPWAMASELPEYRPRLQNG